MTIEPKRISRAEHPISRSLLSSAALRTLYTLKDAGYEAYMVGGGVRDILAGFTPKDFDVATNAHPEQVKPLFRSCRLIGRRFVICHVRFGGEVIETTTFRGAISDSHERDETGRILSDNEYGTLETDAFRRDFTVNALYYDISDFSIVDFCGGLEDLDAKVIRLIGEPEARYREDPVRMLRAVRIANKLGFEIAEDSALPIPRLAHLLGEIPPARLFDEVIKILQSKEAVANYESLAHFGLFAQLFPETDRLCETQDHADDFVSLALANTADRIDNELPVSPAFLYGALLWPPVWARYQALMRREGCTPAMAMQQAADEVLARAVGRVAIPKRFSLPMREIWLLQTRFDQQSPGRARRLMTHPRFRAAYDFLLLRAEVGEVDTALATWWTEAQNGLDLNVGGDDDPDDDASAPRKRRRRRGGRNRRSAPAAAE
ncbi:polynucleotide adenylyltransferase PcnB [Flagellatimonas centrodinii]|uniref:polynucleotide adenylyltransferase PcnB n=1 Tax=Flagellatimonas centrodinii TaxID=2806210 RepID=UPI001FED9774|nr:polynucleotide adenylyltransferase PcnB [Flagellatimonas centrodinii]ULQ45731.1 polynucleotide adenylyltransferase PcnB [Flagellatimonas centrodinii]